MYLPITPPGLGAEVFVGFGAVVVTGVEGTASVVVGGGLYTGAVVVVGAGGG